MIADRLMGFIIIKLKRGRTTKTQKEGYVEISDGSTKDTVRDLL